HGRSIILNEAICQIAAGFLVPHGNMLLKVFDGGHFPGFVQEVRKSFKQVKVVKPDASRDRSREVYVVALDKKLSIGMGPVLIAMNRLIPVSRSAGGFLGKDFLWPVSLA
ncbi:hypothetical protein KA517_04620, partial [Candidatus Gracilibacteria bacterium]|nr:hypothetical protein [Candidatus Gracilibacteria bacterium]